jgi:biotin synthase
MTEAPSPKLYQRWATAALNGELIERANALALLRDEGVELLSLLEAAGQVRHAAFGRTVTIHVLDNVRNGACPEDCGYCGQSRDSDAPIKAYKLKSVEDIVTDATEAQRRGAYRFCMALSGRGPSDADIDHMTEAIRQVSALGLRTCLSAGLLDDAKARQLKEAGLDRLNHNLNTSEANYASICSTHTYQDRLDTLAAARNAGLGVCSGLIVGMGESHDDLLDVAFRLRDLRAESIPVNFLLPIDGNRVNAPMSGGHPLDPTYVLRVLCVMRLINPEAEIRIAAGREAHLRSMQAMALWPANSLFMEGYLLTEGQAARDTVRMIVDAGYTPAFESPDAIPSDLRALVEGNDPSTPTTDHALPETQPLKQAVTGGFVRSEDVGRPA